MSLCQYNEVSDTYFKLFGTTIANMGLGIWKDKIFAQRFNGKPPTKFPWWCIGVFGIRDVLTIGAGFTFPKRVAAAFVDYKVIADPKSALLVAQCVVPMGFQTVLTPIHLLALELYNQPKNSFSQHAGSIRSIYRDSVSMRMMRVLCAYGIAGITNTGLRAYLKENYVNVHKKL